MWILCIYPKNTFQKLHFPEKHLAETTLSQIYISLNVHLPDITFPRTCTCQKLHFPEHARSIIYIFLNMHFPEITLARMLVWQNFHLVECTVYFPENQLPKFTLARMYIWTNVHFPEHLLYFLEFNTWQNLHLAEITSTRNLIFQNLH